jgi:hypothetical protein
VVGRGNRVSANATIVAHYAFDSPVPPALFVFVAPTGFDPVAGLTGLFEAVVERIGADPSGRRRGVARGGDLLVVGRPDIPRRPRGLAEVCDARHDRSTPRELADGLLALATVAVAITLLMFLGVAFTGRVSGPLPSLPGPPPRLRKIEEKAHEFTRGVNPSPF